MSEQKGFLERAFNDMKENAKKQKEIDKEFRETIKRDNQELRENVKEFKSDDLKEFTTAKGLKEKTKVVLSHLERDAQQTAENSRENYKEMLNEQRQNRNELLKKN